MTKKFWKDWQNRLGETKQVYGFCYTDSENIKKRVGGTLITYLPFKIISATFHHHNDTVDLVVEVTSLVAGKDSHHVENKYITLNRNDIGTVKFIKKPQIILGN